MVVAVEETGERKPLALETLRQQPHLRVITVEQEVHPLQTTAVLVEAVLALRVAMDHQLLVVLGRLVLRQALQAQVLLGLVEAVEVHITVAQRVMVVLVVQATAVFI